MCSRVIAMAVAAILPQCALSVPNFQLGACGVYGFPWIYHYQIIDFAAKLALEDGVLNGIIPNTSFLVNITQVHTGCYGSAAAKPSLDMFLGKGMHDGRIYSDVVDTPPVIGIQGCVCAGSSEVVSNLAIQFKVPVISGFATGIELSDTLKHPFFMRTIPPDSAQSRAMAAVLANFGWKRAATVREASFVEGEDFKEALLEATSGSDFELVDHILPASVFYSYDDGSVFDVPNRTLMEASISELADVRPQPRVFMLAGTTAILKITKCLLRQAGFAGPDMVYLGPVKTCDYSMIEWAPKDKNDISHFVARLTEHDLDFCRTSFDEWAGMLCLAPSDKGTFLYSPEWANFWESLSCERMQAVGMPISFGCRDFVFQDISFLEKTMYLTMQFDAMVTLLIGIGTMLASNVTPADIRGDALLDILRSVRFPGLSGDVAFDEKGDRLAPYKIVNVRPNASGVHRLIDIGLFNGATGELVLDVDPLFASGNSTVPADRPAACPDGWEYVSVFLGCQPCPEGSYSPGKDLACIPCQAGTYRNDREMLQCRPCPAGKYCEVGTAEPVECGYGAFCEIGSAQPEACPAGKYSDILNATSCTDCPIATYNPDSGMEVCASCPLSSIPGSTTRYPGRKSAEDCICPKETFVQRPAAGAPGSCEPCPEGLECQAGLEPPLQLPGVHVGAPPFEGALPTFRVFCRDEDVCPGGEMGACPDGSIGMACDRCKVGFTRERGLCVPCTGGNAYAQGIAILLGGVVVVLVLFVMAQIPAAPFLVSKYSIVTMGSLALYAVQNISAFGRVGVHWTDPMNGFMKALQFLALDFEEVKPTCIFGVSEAWKSYLGGVLAYPALAIPLLGLCVLGRAAGRPIPWKACVNVQGLLMQGLFLPLALVAKDPLFCVQNPDGSSSMLSTRAVLCWDSVDHPPMVVLAVVVILGYLVPFVALCTWATYVFKKRLRSPQGQDFFDSFLFLFNNFRMERHWFGVVFLSKKLMIALVPVMVADYPLLQVSLLGTVLAGMLVVATAKQPWRSPMTNTMDAVVACVLIIMLLGCTAGMELSDTELSMVSYYTAYVLLLLAMGFSIVLVVNLHLFVTRERDCKVFISHGGASSHGLARWFKVFLTEQMPADCVVHLGNDRLLTTDEALTVIRQHTKNFLLLLTEGALESFACVMELSSAVVSSTNIVFLCCGACTPPSPEHAVQLLRKACTLSEMACIAPTGMTWSRIEEAYKKLSEVSVVQLDRGAGSLAYGDALKAVLSACRGLGSISPLSRARLLISGLTPSAAAGRGSGPQRAQEKSASEQAPVVIAGDFGNPEVWCVADVLRRFLSPLAVQAEMIADEGGPVEKQLAGARCMLVVLSCGLLQNPACARAIVAAGKNASMGKVLISTEETFIYTSKGSSNALAEIPSVPGYSANTVSKAYAGIFKQPVARFRVSDSHRVLGDQAEHVAAMIAGAGTAQGCLGQLPEGQKPSIRKFMDEEEITTEV